MLRVVATRNYITKTGLCFAQGLTYNVEADIAEELFETAAAYLESEGPPVAQVQAVKDSRAQKLRDTREQLRVAQEHSTAEVAAQRAELLRQTRLQGK